MAIGATAHKLVLDSTKFVEGATLSRAELRLLKTVLKDTSEDTDKLSAGMAALDNLHRKGALSTEQMAKAVKKLEDETTPTAEAVETFGDKLRKLQPTFDPISLGLKAMSAAGDIMKAAFNAVGDAVSYVTTQILNQIEAIDDLVAEADTLGIPVASFQAVAAAAELAELPVNKIGKSMERMLAAVSKGESEKFLKVFDTLGLTAMELRDLAPDQAMGRILTALQGIGDQADRVRFAKEIFGDPDLLRLSADAIDEAGRRLESFGGKLSGLDVASFREFDDSWTKIKQNIEAVWTRFAIELLPAFKEAVTIMEEMPMEDVAAGMRAIADGATLAVLTVKELVRELKELVPPAWLVGAIAKSAVGLSTGGVLAGEGVGAIGRGLGGDLQSLGESQRALQRIQQQSIVPQKTGGDDKGNETLRKIEENTREPIVNVEQDLL